MSFAELSGELQTLLQFQHEVFLKNIYFLILFGFSMLYLFYFRSKQDKTPFFSVAIMRFFLSAFSVINLITLPLLLFSFDPSYSGFDFIFVYFRIYTIALIIYVILLNLDVIRYGVPIMLRIGGIDLKDPGTNLAYQKIKRKFKHGFK